MRKSHFLSHNSKCETPSWFVFVDVETNAIPIDDTKVKAEMFLGYACFFRRYNKRGKQYESEEWLRFTKPVEFFDKLESWIRAKTKVYIFAHNAQFEFQVLGVAGAMKDRSYSASLIIVDSPPFMVEYRRNNTTLLYTDTMNYFAVSLAELGKGIGFEKHQMPDKSAPKEAWDSYCRQDVEVMKYSVLKFIDFVKEHDLGNFQRTLASQAFTAYRHRFMTKPIHIHEDEEASNAERAAYYGGRVECFRLGTITESQYLFDVNSMYPAVMRDNTFPYQLIGKIKDVYLDRISEMCSAFCVVAKTILKTQTPAYPLRADSKLIFPVGEFTTYLSTPEIIYAYQNGDIIQITEAFVYRRFPIFKSFINELYPLRLQYQSEGNKAFQYMVKIFMNSLYGKFGQNGRKWENVIPTSELDFDEWIEVDTRSNETHRFRKALGMVQSLCTNTESFNSFPAIAAHVTAYSRMLLWQYIQLAGRDNVYYCDTDSLLVNETGKARLSAVLDDKELGKLKLEKAMSSTTLNGPKDYVFEDKVKHKGIRAKAKEIAPNTYEQDKFWGLKTAWREGVSDMQVIERITKKLARQYTKGEPTADGRVIPFSLNPQFPAP